MPRIHRKEPQENLGPDKPSEKGSRGESKRYARIRLILSIIEWGFGALFLLAVLFTGFSVFLEERIADWIHSPIPGFLAFCTVLGLIGMILSLPVEFFAGYVVEHRFGLSNQTVGSWILEQCKSLIVGLAIAIPLLVLFYLFYRRFPAGWWIPVGAVFFLFSFLLARLAPVWIFPLFYKCEAVSDAGLVKRLAALAEEAGMNIRAVQSFNLSKNSKKANALFTGLGKSKRVLLADNLLNGFTEEEVLTVAGHELGHYKYGHLWKGLIVGGVFVFGSLALVSGLHRTIVSGWTILENRQWAALPLLVLLLMATGLITAPVQNAISRSFERASDRFAVRITKSAGSFASALDKLAAINKADREPHPWVEFLFYGHPSISRRIKAVAEMGERS